MLLGLKQLNKFQMDKKEIKLNEQEVKEKWFDLIFDISKCLSAQFLRIP